MSLIKLFDAYTLRARVCPAVLAVAPGFAALGLLISWEKIALTNVAATTVLLLTLSALSEFARKQGARIEPHLYEEMGGKPSITMFRRAESTINEHAKEQFRYFVASKINRAVPSEEEEAADQSAADSFYEHAGIWLRANTRDARKFPILWSELVSYGFQRNALGLKWPALAINLTVVIISTSVLWVERSLDLQHDLVLRAVIVLIVAAIHAVYFTLVVSRESVKEVARRYGRELILSCQALMQAHRTITTKRGVG